MQLNTFIDHTILKPEATGKEIDQVVQEAVDNHFATVMVNPYWVSHVHGLLNDSEVKTATVIGFPLGANTTKIKILESKQAILDGADELDMVMNIGELKADHKKNVLNDIKAVVEAGHAADKIVKVIIETALLTDEEIGEAAELVVDANADFIKTSTGFSKRGASIHDIELLNSTVGDRIKIKAAGGIHSAEVARKMIEAGASRLGVSASMKLISEQ